MPFVPRTSSEIIKEMAGLVVTQSKLTDINPGSALTHLIGSVAQEIEFIEIRMQGIRDSFSLIRASGPDLDYRVGDLPPSGLARKGQSAAGGAALQVTLVDALEVDLVIPIGTVYARQDNGLEYVQTQQVTVLAGTTAYPTDASSTGYIRVVCKSSGSDGNCASGLITELVQAPADLDTVTNVIAVGGGSESESDDSLRNRALSYLAALSRITSASLKYVVLSYVSPITGETAKSCTVIEDAMTPGFTEVMVDPGGSAFDETIQNFTGGDAVTDTGTKWTWAGKMPSVLHHTAPALKALTIVDFETTFYRRVTVDDVPADIVETRSMDDVLVRAFYQLPPGWDPFISVYERGHIYLDPEFPMNYAPSHGYQVGDAETQKPVQLTLKPFNRYTGLIAELQGIIEGDVSRPSDFPGFRPAGCRVVCRLPILQKVGQIKINLTLVSGTKITEVEDLVKGAVVSLVNDLIPGDFLRLAAIIDMLMGIPFIKNVKITSPDDDVVSQSNRSVLRIALEDVVLS
jgi:hypothetical protein